MEHIVIIGNGIAGATAARHIRKLSNKKITMISAESDNFFSRTALMYVYMGHMRFEEIEPYPRNFWKDNEINCLKDYVEMIDFSKKELTLSQKGGFTYDKLILALGSKPNKFGWKGEDLEGVQGLYSKQDLELMEQNTKGISKAVIIGGGLIGVEMAEMLLSRNIAVDILVRDDHFWGSVLPDSDAAFVEKHLALHHGLRVICNEELEEVLADEQGKVKAVKTKNSKEEIPCQFVGLTAGVSPNVDFLKDSELDVGRGIKVDRKLATNIKDVYAIGDCTEQLEPVGERRGIEQVWYTGRIMGETVAQTICENPTVYSPGNWFNSAKFFDLEYQTYGWVFNKLKAGEAEFVYQNEAIHLHFVYDRQEETLIGVNSFGLRLRHDVFDHWLSKGAKMDEVIADLQSAFFDPEFYKNYYRNILACYNKDLQRNISPKKKQWWRKLINA